MPLRNWTSWLTNYIKGKCVFFGGILDHAYGPYKLKAYVQIEKLNNIESQLRIKFAFGFVKPKSLLKIFIANQNHCIYVLI